LPGSGSSSCADPRAVPTVPSSLPPRVSQRKYPRDTKGARLTSSDDDELRSLLPRGTEPGDDWRALIAWGLKYERQPLGADEAAHPEHLIAGLEVALNEVNPRPSRLCAWRFEFEEPDGSFDLSFDGKRWSAGAQRRPDVVVSTTARALAE